MKSSTLWRLCVVSLALGAVPSRAPATAQAPPEAWITLGQKEAAHIQASLREAGREDVLRVDAEGDIVVARIREDDIPVVSRIVHRDLHRCGGFVWHPTREAAFEAAAAQPPPPSEPLVDYTIDNGPVVQALMGPLQEANIRSTITSLAGFFTRYHNCPSGQQSALWIRDLWLGYAAGRPDVSVQLFNHTGYTTLQPSVILTIQGTTLPGEVVVLGAHQDSIAGSNCSTSRAPGADDDASGIASLSEVIRVALSSGYRPSRTVKFMAYAAEEVGLRGSAQIAQQHLDQGINVVGVFQLDMTNYKGTPSADIVVYTDFTNAPQNAFVSQLVDAYLALPRTTSACGYGCSDHASWTNRGFVASFPFEAVFGQHNPTIHTSNDTLAQSGNNANHALKFSRLAAAYVGELAKGGFGGTNQRPTANAGPDQSAATGSTVTLSGSGNDPDGGPGPLTFAWSRVSGPAVTINNASQAVATVTPTTAGVYVFRLTVGDGALTASDDATVTITSPGGTAAVFDAGLQAPRCAAVGSACDTGASLVRGRAGLGPEPNQPNTINDSCADGTSGTFHSDESNDRVRVFTTDGTSFAPGKTVTIEATVWAWTTPSSDAADFFYAPNAASPSWTLIGTRVPTAAGAQVLSINYTLPAGAQQAVRVQYRYQSSSAACAAGAYNDRDDLVFAVDSPSATTVYFDNFEAAAGWTANPGGTDTATSGQWERGDPAATTSSGAKQLGTTVSGVNDLVTGRLAGAAAGDFDVDGGTTSIQSPAIPLPSTGTLTLSFSYYLAHGSNSSSADFFRVRVVGTTTTTVLNVAGAAANRNGAWTSFSGNVSGHAGQTVRILIDAADAGTASLLEAGVDDVRITRQ
jgi:bacterial leucyl aminopeptidase